MTGPDDDWDDPDPVPAAPETASENPFPGYRKGGRDWSPPAQPSAAVIASSGRIFAIADMHVERFARRPGIILDLPGVVAACLTLVHQAGHLAMTATRMQREIDAAWGDTMMADELREEFGGFIEAAMAQHAQWLLEQWYARRSPRE